MSDAQENALARYLAGPHCPEGDRWLISDGFRAGWDARDGEVVKLREQLAKVREEIGVCEREIDVRDYEDKVYIEADGFRRIRGLLSGAP